MAVVHLLALPRSYWEFDEPLFALALWNYEPLQHNPPPPGYPLFIAVGKLLNFFFRDSFTALVALSFLSVAVGFTALARAFAAVTEDRTAGVLGALLFYLSPVMLIHGTLPQSDSPALAFLAVTLLLAGAGRPGWTGLAAAATVGMRPQMSIFIVPFLAVLLLVTKGWRGRARLLAVFTAGCLAWIIPLALELGGVRELIEYETGQAAYFAAHDASISRGGWSTLKIVGRFAARPWGPVWLAATIVLLALAGLDLVRRRRLLAAAPLLVGSGVYLVFALATMDPADGARYALPSVVAVAFLAGAGLRRLAGGSRAGFAAAAGLALIATGYTSSLLVQRATTPSPPGQAKEWILRNLPRNTHILVELPLWPHAKLWLADYPIHRMDEGFAMLGSRPDLPAVVLANGRSDEDGAQVFRWHSSQAYEKLTRNHYRVVSIIPLPPGERIRLLGGVYGTERDAVEGWRWLAPEARIALPAANASVATFRFGLTPTTPYDAVNLSLLLNGTQRAAVVVRKSGETRVSLPLAGGSNLVTIRSDRSFVPADADRGVGDPRRLAVRLIDIDQQ